MSSAVSEGAQASEPIGRVAACASPFLIGKNCDYLVQTGLLNFALGTQNPAGVVVGYVSTGLNFSLKSLTQHIHVNPLEAGRGVGADRVDNDQNGFVDDFMGLDLYLGAGLSDDSMLGLGTFASSILISEEQTFVGLAPFARIVPIKAIAENGYSTPSLAAKAITYAIAMGARVVHLEPSFAVDNVDELCDAIETARANDVLIVSPAGNTGQKVDYRNVPAGCGSQNLIIVAAATKEGKLADFSAWAGDLVHLAAPGVGIVGLGSNGQLQQRTGSNVAAALVTVAVTLLRARFPKKTSLQISELLMQNVKLDPSLQSKTISGGVLNLQTLKVP